MNNIERGFMKTYKVVKGPMGFTVDRGNSESAFKGFEEIINRETDGGWTYHSMETIEVEEKQGCFSQPKKTFFYMLIFEKDE
ncbi:MAG: DUF4177 domain-containing protein [Firmicutes bacterium]|nr:DUF4177 domain-containing protein [Bacillota bacterium]